MTTKELLQSFASDAADLENQGRYGEAADHYALRAFTGLVQDDFTYGRSARLSFAHTLSALVCDVRAGQRHQARRFFEILRPFYTDMIEDVDDVVLAGLLEEWLGDSLLVLADATARTHYQRAQRVYETESNPGRNWAFEEEFDYAYWAFEAFMESKGRSVPNDIEYDFELRIQFKLDLVEELLGE